ncbi:hypothetical protein BJ508DRAFT_411219 [Ascobolus immersus RN42]|uniref:Uncharacterized protein n=1 Tax=Ascobolus immersus RN42 TaxID=1160509 RepID=A0A3N4IK67_ASCIM|nr:hypothetical protein BJ508DRAFT_411219 [Ascobolus immersus RN42]
MTENTLDNEQMDLDAGQHSDDSYEYYEEGYNEENDEEFETDEEKRAKAIAISRYLHSLKSDIISPDIHKLVIDHHASHPYEYFRQLNYDDDKPVFSADSIFSEFYSGLCISPAPNATSDSLQYPPPFVPIIEDMLQFYVKTFHVYFYGKLHSPTIRPAEGDPREALIWMVSQLGRREMAFHKTQYMASEPLQSVVRRRWETGLLREAQVKLVGHLFDKLWIELKALVEIETANERLRLVELNRRIIRAGRAMRCFFDNGRFRSERLEGLLLKYLSEDEEVDTQLLHGLEEVQREFESDDGLLDQSNDAYSMILEYEL